MLSETRTWLSNIETIKSLIMFNLEIVSLNSYLPKCSNNPIDESMNISTNNLDEHAHIKEKRLRYNKC